MVHEKNKRGIKLALIAGILLLFSGNIFAQQDPPSRVARLNYLNGNVSMEPAGVDEWAPADVNRPFTIGDYLYADQGAEAELHLDVAVIRMGSQTSFGFLNLDDRTVQLKLTEGDLDVRLQHFGSDEVFEVDTPNAAVTLLRDGTYRFRVDPNGTLSFVVVREGQAQVTGGGQAFLLNADNSATLNGTDQMSYDIELAPQPDEFDQWCEQRDAHEARSRSARYLPPSVIGSEDLDDYGSWQNTGQYGQVWYPQNVDPGWAPYHAGHWAWIEPWGWTWIDSMPWGFAPFHYGRWAYIGNRWGWCPGPIAVGYGGPVVRPYYAPAMVAWFGGEHFGVGISLGGGPSLGWVPLGWGEVYTPAYQCSPRYFNNVNVYNTRVVNNVNITNVYNTVYVNKQVYNQQFVNVRAPNAVMAMPQAAFASGRPVRQAGVPVRQADFARLQTAAVITPPVAPTRQGMIPTAGTRAAARPPAQVLQRQVIARVTPPAAPTFAARQPNAPFARPAVVARPVAANVRQAPAANPVAVRPGERGGYSAGRPSTNSAGVPGGNSVNNSGRGPINTPPNNPATNSVAPNRPGAPAAQSRVGVSGPAEQPVTPAAHGVPPNRQTQPAAEPNGRVAPSPTVQSNRQLEPGVPPNRQPQPEERRPTAAASPAVPPPPAHGVPPNRQTQPAAEPNGRVAPSPTVQSNRQLEPGVPPNRQTQPEERRPTAAASPAAPPPPAHGVPPNRQTQPAAEPNGRVAPSPAVQSNRQPEPGVPPNRQPQPEERHPTAVASPAAPLPPAHGVPPNRRQENSQAPAENGRYAQPAPTTSPRPPQQEQNQPTSGRPAPANDRSTVRQQPEIQERTQPAPERSAPGNERPASPARQQPQIQERTQPAPERSVPERPAPVNERPAPAPERHEYPAKSPEPQERSQPNRQESRPPAHEDHPKSDKKSR